MLRSLRRLLLIPGPRVPRRLLSTHDRSFPFDTTDNEDITDTHPSLSENTPPDDIRLFNYIDICVQIGQIDHAWVTLKQWAARSSPQVGTDFFNIIMFAHATQADVDRLEAVLGEMHAAGVESNIFTHIAVLGCLGKIGAPAQTKAGRYIERARSKGFDFNEVFDYIFMDNLDLTESAKSVLRSHGFAPSRKHSFDLNNELVNHLNDVKVAKNTSLGCLSRAQAELNIQEQLDAERLSFRKIKLLGSREHQGQQPYRLMYENLKKEWRRVLKERIDRLSFSSLSISSTFVAPYAMFFTPDEAAAFMVEDIEEFLGHYLQGSQRITRTQAALDIGQKFHKRVSFRRKLNIGQLDQIVSTYRRYVRDVAERPELPFNMRRHWCRLMRHEDDADILTFYREWGTQTLLMVGGFFLNLIMENITINKNLLCRSLRSSNVSIPVFYAVHHYEGGRLYVDLRLHPVLVNLFKEANVDTTLLDVVNFPMRTPPIPWLSAESGPFMSFSYNMIRSPISHVTGSFVANYPVASYAPVLDGVSHLQMTPWAINTRIYHVLLHFFDRCHSVYIRSPRERIKNADSLEDLLIAYAFVKPSSDEKCFETSLRMLRLKLSIASSLIGSPFWFPLFIDFRGRSYPIPPHLNHTGDDLSRSLLVFSVGKPLGPGGLSWLKIHLANLTGQAKRLSNDERIVFVDRHMEDVVDSADNPIHGRRWWLTLEKPYQTLALCMEIVSAMRSDDPAAYVSHLPIHQDGSFNGLQHYAALGRDAVAAKSVNLIPHSHPRDAYLDVVELVEQIRVRDEREGSSVAASLKGCISRRVVKQTVMTTVYGVTRYGADLQVQRRLLEMGDRPLDIPVASSYVSGAIFKALGNIFQSTSLIQNWLKYNAIMISSFRSLPVHWITPLGLPILQPYFTDGRLGARLNPTKQKNALPPNFIHSLDATHMLLTALHSKSAGVMFAAVHDCYWSHPSDVDAMNRICREQFVALHSRPLLEEMDRQFRDIISANGVRRNSRVHLDRVDVPASGEFDLAQIIHSEYFFS